MSDETNRHAERSMERADVANGEGEPDEAADKGVNDVEAKYGADESPA